MSTFKERLEIEKQELDWKMNKLGDFIVSDNFPTVDTIQQSLLKIQFSAMETYSKCLGERLTFLNQTVTTN